MMFAIAAIPVVGMVGAAVDFSHANSVKAAMQAALNSTALILSKNAAGLTNDQLQTAAQNYFNAMFNRPEAKNIVITASYTTTGGTALSVSGSATVPTTFLGVLGYNEIPVTDKSTTKWGSSRLRVALALDNTGSMDSDGKIGALKTATKNLLNQLKGAASVPDDVYVSIVPFAKDVKLDTTGYNSTWDSWIAWDDGSDSSWDGANGSCSMGNKSPRSTCVAQGSCSISGNYSQSSCTACWHLLDLDQNDAKHLHQRGHLLDLQPNDPEHLHERRRLLESGQNDPEHLHGIECLHLVGLYDEQPVHVARRRLGQRHLDAGCLDGRRVDARRVDAGDLDAQQSYRLERLLHGSRRQFGLRSPTTTG